MRFVWLTDLRLNFLKVEARTAFIQQVAYLSAASPVCLPGGRQGTDG